MEPVCGRVYRQRAVAQSAGHALWIAFVPICCKLGPVSRWVMEELEVCPHRNANTRQAAARAQDRSSNRSGDTRDRCCESVGLAIWVTAVVPKGIEGVRTAAVALPTHVAIICIDPSLCAPCLTGHGPPLTRATATVGRQTLLLVGIVRARFATLRNNMAHVSTVRWRPSQ